MSLSLISNISERPRPDVVIVGAGIVGLMSALQLNRLGVRPLIVDRLAMPAGQTSRRSGEGLRAQWELAQNIDIAQRSIQFYANLAEEFGLEGATAGYRPVGYLYGARSEAGYEVLKKRVALQESRGLQGVEFLEGAEALARYPMLSPQIRGAAFRAQDGVLEIEKVYAALLQVLDADLLLQTEVGAIKEAASGVMIETSRGDLSCGQVVLANGARLAPMLASLSSAVRVRPARSTIVRLKAAGLPEDHTAVVDVDAGSFWRPDFGGARMTATFRGNLFVPDYTDDPQIDPDYLSAALASVTPMFPFWGKVGAHLTDYHYRSGTFAVTQDGAPIIGVLPGHARIFVNGGYGGHGVMMSPDGGRRLANAVVGQADGIDPFRPSRFCDGSAVEVEAMTVHLHGQE